VSGEAKNDLAWDLLEAGDLQRAHNLFVEVFEEGDVFALIGLAEIYKSSDFTEVQRLVNIARSYTDQPFLIASMIFYYLVPEVWTKTSEAMQGFGEGRASLEFPDFNSTVAARAQIVQELGDVLHDFYLMGGLIDNRDARKYLEFVLSEGKLLYTFSLVLVKQILRSARMLLESSNYQVREQTYSSIGYFFENIATPDHIGAMYLINNLQDELVTFEDVINFFRETAQALEEIEPLVDSIDDLATIDIACEEAIRANDNISIFVYQKIIGNFLESNINDLASPEVERLKAKYMDSSQ